MKLLRPRIWLPALAGAAVIATAGWLLLERSADAASPNPAASTPPTRAGRTGDGPPISVTTFAAQRRDQPVDINATGTVAPLNVVDVRAQVGNPITQVHVREGQFVQRGQPLFSLDDRTDQVNLARARAQLTKDQAALADAQRQLARAQDLMRQQFLSQSAADSAQTLVATQQGAVAVSQAAVQGAELALGYDRIAAPSAGRVGAINVFPGTLVQAGNTVLLTITQLDPIAVSFNLPQRYLAEALDGLHEGHTEVHATLPGANRQSSERRPTSPPASELVGRLDFVDSAVDAGSGTVRVKAVFANPKQQLWPGAYAEVKLTLRTMEGAIVVPQDAIVRNQEGDSVYLVGPDSTAVQRKVRVLLSTGTEAVVSGIAAGDPVIVAGRANVRPGSRVAVKS